MESYREEGNFGGEARMIILLKDRKLARGEGVEKWEGLALKL